jgi:hypothetical protein
MWIRIRIICGRLDPDLIGNADLDPNTGGQKMTDKSEEISSFEMLDVLL